MALVGLMQTNQTQTEIDCDLAPSGHGGLEMSNGVGGMHGEICVE